MKKYKLIKTFPGSPELGTIEEMEHCFKNLMMGSNGKYLYNISESPEFWELVVEKDYEILSFINVNNKIYELRLDGRYFNDELKYNNYQYCLEVLKIHSIKRLSDDEIFTIDDDVLSKTCGVPNKILSIELINNKIRLYPRNSFYNLEDISKVKQKLFTTEDGVDIFEADKYTIVTDDLFEIKTLTASGNDIYNVKKFSTKEKAEEYIIMNKPSLSINDMLNKCKAYITPDLENSLKNLVKTKLKK